MNCNVPWSPLVVQNLCNEEIVIDNNVAVSFDSACRAAGEQEIGYTQVHVPSVLM